MEPLFKRKTTIKEIFNNDKEKEEKLNKITELLTAAGYARARLPNLEPLDKILGGITWSLTSCFFEVEFEFKEEMSIGEKVKVSEKITKALKQANCPISINPIQLQGLDLDAIYVLIQWLVKNMHETRDEKNDLTRKIALTYSNVNISKVEKHIDNIGDNLSKRFSDVFNKTKYDYLISGRQLRTINAKANLKYNDELRVYLTLLEYGLNKDLSFQKTLIELLRKNNMIKTDNTKSTTITLTSPVNPLSSIVDSHNSDQNEKSRSFSIVNNKSNDNSKQELTENQKKELHSIISTDQYGIEKIEKPTHSNKSNKIQASILEEILNNNITNITSEILKFEESEKNDSFDKLKFIVKEKERLNNVKVNIHQQIELYNKEFNILTEENSVLLEKLKELSSTNKTINKEITNSSSQLSKLEEKIKASNYSKEKFEMVSEKIEQRETLKEEISKFKVYCKEERVKLESKLESIDKKKNKMNSEENQIMFDEIDMNYNEELNNLLQKKQNLFEENKLINILLRKIQVNPSKLELLQYQKRFEELYEQINIVSEKNREMINESNSKEEVLKLLNQKMQTFIDLREVYKNLKSKKDKENFKNTLQEVLENVEESAKRSSNKPTALRKDVDSLKSKLIQHQEYEQKYMRLVKEYNREYNRIYSGNI